MKRIIKQNMKDAPGNAQSYETHLQNGPRTADGEPIENVRANPDSLFEGQQLWGDSEMTRPQALMGEAIQHLQGRQKEVYELIMRDGRSVAEAGKLLGISKATAQDYKERAIKFITAYCRAILAKEDHETL